MALVALLAFMALIAFMALMDLMAFMALMARVVLLALLAKVACMEDFMTLIAIMYLILWLPSWVELLCVALGGSQY